jgi:hypothetical protein
VALLPSIATSPAACYPRRWSLGRRGLLIGEPFAFDPAPGVVQRASIEGEEQDRDEEQDGLIKRSRHGQQAEGGKPAKRSRNASIAGECLDRSHRSDGVGGDRLHGTPKPRREAVRVSPARGRRQVKRSRASSREFG